MQILVVTVLFLILILILNLLESGIRLRKRLRLRICVLYGEYLYLAATSKDQTVERTEKNCSSYPPPTNIFAC